MNYPIEVGPIRPVDEADSLLIRTTRNCPWNRCGFCVNYHGESFSIRSPEEIKQDIEAAADYFQGHVFTRCFLQDGDSLIMKTADLLDVLRHLKVHFPELEIISSYGRTQSILRKSEEELKEICAAGLNLLYCGMESGSDEVLQLVNKGVGAAQVIDAGIRANTAGMYLSEFIILGLGGSTYSKDHAHSTAKALNAINPDKIRVLTLGIKEGSDLQKKWQAGDFDPLPETQMIEEQLLLLENIEGITSHYANHHAVDLLLEVRGQLPQDKEKLITILLRFLDLSEHKKHNFILGRRLGIYNRLDDLHDNNRYQLVEDQLKTLLRNGNTDLELVFHTLRAKIV